MQRAGGAFHSANDDEVGESHVYILAPANRGGGMAAELRGGFRFCIGASRIMHQPYSTPQHVPVTRHALANPDLLTITSVTQLSHWGRTL